MKVNQLYSASIYTNDVVSTDYRTVSFDSKASTVLGPIVTFKNDKSTVNPLLAFSQLVVWTLTTFEKNKTFKNIDTKEEKCRFRLQATATFTVARVLILKKSFPLSKALLACSHL